MQFIGGAASKAARMFIPRLDGGLNLREKSSRIQDNQLADCTNLWWRDGALRPRPGIRRGESALRARPEGTTLSISRENGTGKENGQRRVWRRFVERTPGSGIRATFTLGTLYRDGEQTYSQPLLLEGSPEEQATGRLANRHGLAVDTAIGGETRTLVFFGCGRVYAVKNGIWSDLSEELTVPRLLFGGRGTALPTDTPPDDGVCLESRNLLTPKFRALYSTDGKATTFFLPLQNLDNRDVLVRITGANGTAVTHTIPAGSSFSGVGSDGYAATVDRAAGRITVLNSAANPAAPPYAKPNNLEIVASKTDVQALDRIYGMTFHTWYSGNPGGTQAGARLFFAGNPQYPHLVHWSHFGDPLYFPEYNYNFIGQADEAVTGFGHQGETLVVFKEHAIYGVDYVLRPLADREDTTDLTTVGVYFPVTQIANGIGCDAPLTICSTGSRLLWASGAHVYLLTSLDAVGRGIVRVLSGPVSRELEAQDPSVRQTASAGLFDGCYLLQAGRRVYALQAEEALLLRFGRSTTDSQAEKQIAWSRWEVQEGLEPQFLLAGEGEAAFLGTVRYAGGPQSASFALAGETDTVWSGSGEEEREVPWRLATKVYDFGYPEREKAVVSMQIGLTVDRLRRIALAYVTEKGIREEWVQAPPEGGWLRRMPGCTRTRRFGVCVRGSGRVEVDGLTVSYRMPG